MHQPNEENTVVDLPLESTDPAITHYPSPLKKPAYPLSKDEKKRFIEQRFREILEVLDLDLENDSMKRTPERVAKMYVEEIFSGLDYGQFPKISLFENQFQHKSKTGMIGTKTHFNSCCEHHLMPIIGEAYIAYLPGQKIIGLSKIPRIVKYFAKRPQIQERLTMQIADSLSLLLGTEDVAVRLVAKHLCVSARGVEDELGMTTTQILKGAFESDSLLQEQFFRI